MFRRLARLCRRRVDDDSRRGELYASVVYPRANIAHADVRQLQLWITTQLCCSRLCRSLRCAANLCGPSMRCTTDVRSTDLCRSLRRTANLCSSDVCCAANLRGSLLRCSTDVRGSDVCRTADVRGSLMCRSRNELRL